MILSVRQFRNSPIPYCVWGETGERHSIMQASFCVQLEVRLLSELFHFFFFSLVFHSPLSITQIIPAYWMRKVAKGFIFLLWFLVYLLVRRFFHWTVSYTVHWATQVLPWRERRKNDGKTPFSIRLWKILEPSSTIFLTKFSRASHNIHVITNVFFFFFVLSSCVSPYYFMSK